MFAILCILAPEVEIRAMAPYGPPMSSTGGPTAGCYLQVKMVVAELVIAELGKNQLPASRLRLQDPSERDLCVHSAAPLAVPVGAGVQEQLHHLRVPHLWKKQSFSTTVLSTNTCSIYAGYYVK